MCKTVFKISGAIFDLDGTLLDSMPVWRTVACSYLRTLDVTAPEDIWRPLKPLSLWQSAEYLKREFNLALSIEDIMRGINRQIENAYFYEMPLKLGVKELLETLRKNKVPAAIATATDRYCVEAALERTGIAQYFSAIKTCTEAGAGKRESPRVFDDALCALGTKKETTLIFEDALHAVVTAKRAGYSVIAVADSESEDDEIPIRMAADYFASDMFEAAARLVFPER
ncbi:MAG: HAD family phosphatase [Bacteroides sp.]|nr:HAD family phosphatase [Prevotella sp.]MCM1407567.1 HAD family phosphatase [Treponema brennaborense]MCM1469283.1 HAD family phosphatase [Bacteroides sp.]